jgi:hypothetical protein
MLYALVQMSEQGKDAKGNIEKANSEPWIVDAAGVVHPREPQVPDFQNGVVSVIPSKQLKRRLTPTGLYKHSFL